MLSISSAIVVAFAFSGCAVRWEYTDLNTSFNKINTHVYENVTKEAWFAQDENVKKAVAILIDKTAQNETELASLRGSFVKMGSTINTITQENEGLKQRLSSLENRVGLQSSTIEQKLTDLERNMSAKQEKNNTKVTNTNSSIKIKEQTDISAMSVKIKSKRTALFDKPNGSIVKYAKKGERYRCDENNSEGYYHLITDNLYVKTSDAVTYKIVQKKAKDDHNKTKRTTKKQNVKTGIKPEVTITQPQSDASFFEEKAVSTPTQQAKKIEPRLSNSEQIKNAEIARSVAGELALDANVTDSNIEQKCAVALLSKGIQSDKNRMYIDVCIASYRLAKNKK